MQPAGMVVAAGQVHPPPPPGQRWVMASFCCELATTRAPKSLLDALHKTWLFDPNGRAGACTFAYPTHVTPDSPKSSVLRQPLPHTDPPHLHPIQT